MLGLCVDWRRLKNLLVPDSGGLADMQSIVPALRDKQCFAQLYLATVFDQVPTAFRDPEDRFWEFKEQSLA